MKLSGARIRTLDLVYVKILEEKEESKRQSQLLIAGM